MPRAAAGGVGPSLSSLSLIAAATSWGLFWGGWAALLPEIKAQVDTDAAGLGLALFGIPAGAAPGMLLTGALNRRLRERTLPVVLVAFAAACVLPGLAHSPWSLAIMLTVVGATSGGIEVALNATTAGHEARDGSRLFNKVHAATPLAMVVAAPLAGLLRQSGASATQVLLVVAALVLLSAGLTVDRSGRWVAAGDDKRALGRCLRCCWPSA